MWSFINPRWDVYDRRGSFRLQLFCLKYLGLWPPEDADERSRKRYIAYGWALRVVFMHLYIVTQVLYFKDVKDINMVLAISSIVGWTVSSAFDNERRLPLPAWFPFDYHRSWTTYGLLFLYQTIGIVMSATYNFSTDTMFSGLMLHLKEQIVRLGSMVQKTNQLTEFVGYSDHYKFNKATGKAIVFFMQIVFGRACSALERRTACFSPYVFGAGVVGKVEIDCHSRVAYFQGGNGCTGADVCYGGGYHLWRSIGGRSSMGGSMNRSKRREPSDGKLRLLR
uniref:Uncharacterized protein n=1 Tax=Anopheles atroparvus TaxID=41427 RepID=A0A182JM54_ANOAO